MAAYLNSRPSSFDLGPRFIYVSGAFLTREKLTREMRLLISKGGLDSSEFAGHSFQIRAATIAASANLPPWLIKVLHCWASDCFERYIKTPPSVLAQVPQQLLCYKLASLLFQVTQMPFVLGSLYLFMSPAVINVVINVVFSSIPLLLGFFSQALIFIYPTHFFSLSVTVNIFDVIFFFFCT